MELLLRFGNTQQQQQYLLPLLKGETRSCFAMTEPNTASSNPTQIQTTITGEAAFLQTSALLLMAYIRC
jgi:alkylation response protein AidB-like acyl-CoA dehydrogenase